MIEDGQLVVAPGCFDALTAKIAESIGFDAVYLGGYAAGASTGATEPMATMTEMCDRAQEITHKVDVPLIVDGNAGFGNPSHTYRTVQKFAQSGIAALHIEDQLYPKRLHYHERSDDDWNVHIEDQEEMEMKIRTAVRAREDINEDIVIIGRTDAARGGRRQIESIDDAIDRGNAYLDAGADVAFLFPKDREELEYIAEHIDGPTMFNLSEGREPHPTTEELEEIGYSIMINSSSASVVTARAVRDLFERLYEDGETGLEIEETSELKQYIEARIDLPKFYKIEEEAGKKEIEK
jgi:methylisocitrate lyase